MLEPLPDPLLPPDGVPITSAHDWAGWRDSLQQMIMGVEYGPLPPSPRHIQEEQINQHIAKRYGGVRHAQYRLTTHEPDCTFILDLLVPEADSPLPVIVNGDGCWLPLQETIVCEVLQRGYILAVFNRCEIVPDNAELGRTTGLYRQCPGAGFGAIGAWAWGFHRCVDVLQTLPAVDAQRIGVVGHSRGGKASLLAGATDPRIALTAANGSGCGGAGCFRIQGPRSESLKDIVERFPHWFSPRLNDYIGREAQLPFDQHHLKALVAPRLLLTTEALDDLWANPLGSWHTHVAAQRVYGLLGADDCIGIAFRPGEHVHHSTDWQALLHFTDLHWRGVPSSQRFDQCPFPDL